MSCLHSGEVGWSVLSLIESTLGMGILAGWFCRRHDPIYGSRGVMKVVTFFRHMGSRRKLMAAILNMHSALPDPAPFLA